MVHAMMLRAGLLCAAALVASGCGDADKTTTVTDTATRHGTSDNGGCRSSRSGTGAGIGDEIELPEAGLTVQLISLRRGATADEPSLPAANLTEGGKSPDTHEFVKMKLRATTSEDSDGLFFFGFALVDEDGQRYDEIDQSPAVFEPHATGEELAAGDTIKGVTGFVFPKSGPFL